MENTRYLDRKTKSLIAEIEQVESQPAYSQRERRLAEVAATLKGIARKSFFGWDAVRHLLQSSSQVTETIKKGKGHGKYMACSS